MFLGTVFSGTIVAMPTTCQKQRLRGVQYMNLHVYGCVCVSVRACERQTFIGFSE